MAATSDNGCNAAGFQTLTTRLERANNQHDARLLLLLLLRLLLLLVLQRRREHVLLIVSQNCAN